MEILPRSLPGGQAIPAAAGRHGAGSATARRARAQDLDGPEADIWAREADGRGNARRGEGGAHGATVPHSGTHFRPHLAHRSLLQLLNRTRTGAGMRLLRASLLQPLTSPEGIRTRQDAVQVGHKKPR